MYAADSPSQVIQRVLMWPHLLQFGAVSDCASFFGWYPSSVINAMTYAVWSYNGGFMHWRSSNHASSSFIAQHDLRKKSTPLFMPPRMPPATKWQFAPAAGRRANSRSST